MKKWTLINLLLMSLWVFISSECIAQWTTMEPIPTPRVQATASNLNGKIYVIGGFLEEGGNAVATVEAYDPRTNTWDSNIADYPLPVSYASSQVVNDTLYVLGGTNREHGGDTYYKEVYAYNDHTNSWTRKADMPNPNAYHKTVVVEDTIYMLGGSQGTLAENKFLAYDCRNDSWVELPDVPVSRGFMDVQAIGQFIYLAGGAYLGQIQETAFQYDCEKKEWKPIPPLPEPLAFNGSGNLENELYIFGGLTYWDYNGPNSVSSRNTWKLHIEADTTYWMDTEEDMPIEIIGYAHAVGEDALGRQAIYIFSGATKAFYNAGAAPSSKTLKYTKQKETAWHYKKPMPTPRALSSTVQYMGMTYVIGGVESKTSEALQTVEMYDIRFDRWYTDLPALPAPICQAAAEVFGNTIFLIGGADYYLGDPQRTLYAYDIMTKEWERKADMPSGMISHASVVYKDHIYVAGGVGEDGFATDQVFRYHPDTDQWETLPAMAYPRAFCGLHVDEGEYYQFDEIHPAGIIVTGGMMYGQQLEHMERLNIHQSFDSEGVFYAVDPEGWKPAGNMPVKRYWHGSGHRDRSLFILGGIGTENRPIFNLMKLNIPETRWTEIGEPLPEYSSPFTLSSITANDNECFYAIGGPTPDFWNGGNGPRVTGLNLMSCMNVVGVKTTPDPKVWEYLKQNYPNPCIEVTHIPFVLEKAGDITLEILDLNGKRMNIIYSGFKPAGKHTVTWQTVDLPSGVYFYQLTSERGKTVRKMIVHAPH